MTSHLAAVVVGWIVGRNDPRRPAHVARPDSPMTQLMHCNQALRAALRREYPSWSPEAEVQRSDIQRLLGSSLDYRELSRRALGHTWDQLSAADQNDFVAELRTVIEHRYVRGEMAAPDVRLNFVREVTSDGGTASVYGTLVGHANHKALHVMLEYRMLWRNDRWIVYDLVTDGNSLLDSYRMQFERIIARESFAGLKQRLKRAEGDSDDR